MAKVPVADYDNMVNTLPSDRADQPFRTSVFATASAARSSISYAHRPDTPDEYFAVDAIPIPSD